MKERTAFSSIGAAGLACVQQVVMFIEPLKWVAFALLFLLIYDFRLGVRESKKKGIKVRPSSAFRRTMVKAIDYTCAVLIVAAFQQILINSNIVFPLFPLVAFLVICSMEIESVINHLLVLNDKPEINIFGAVLSFCKKSSNKLVANVSESISENRKTKKRKKTVKN